MNPFALTANKAWLAAVVTGLASFTATVQGRTDLDTMKTVDWLIVILSAVVAGVTVYQMPNKDTAPKVEPAPEEATASDVDLREE